MLRFAIGVGINSVSGAQIERALIKNYPPEDFEILPVVESDYIATTMYKIQQRAVSYAERAKAAFAEAEAYFGIASGLCIFRDTPAEDAFCAPARADVISVFVRGAYLPPQLLDPQDIRWQMNGRVCALASTKRSVREVAAYVRMHCGYKALPSPPKR